MRDRMRRFWQTRWPARLARGVLAGVFLWAGLAKLTHREDFFNAVAHYKLLTPNQAYRLVQVLPQVEIAIALLILLPWRRLYRSGLLAYALLLLLFTGGLTSLWLRGEHVNCGCFGGSGDMHPALPIARNLALFALGLIAWREPGKWIKTPTSVEVA